MNYANAQYKIFVFIIFFFFATCHVAVAAIFYVDPATGDIGNPGTMDQPWSTIQEVIEANYIISNAYSVPYDPVSSSLAIKNLSGYVSAGDTLMLREGMHGEIFLRNYVNDDMITILGMEGEKVSIEKIQLQGGKNWRFENLEVSTEPYGYHLAGKLLFIESHGWQGPCSHVEVLNCKIFSVNEPWTVAQDWVDHSSSGIHIIGDSVMVVNNLLTNIDHGITAVGDYIYAYANVIENFSGDGMRPLGSFVEFNSNLIKNCYDVDDNHDDGIQSFTTNGHVVDNILIIGNVIINTDDPNRPLNGPLQGIVGFDGWFNNWIIANNVVNVNHWHGISLYGARNCSIINNTVIDPTPDVEPGASWIRINDHKDGSPSSDCIVVNNVSNNVVAPGFDFNNILLSSYSEYDSNFKNYQAIDFSLLSESVLIGAADGNYATAQDITGSDRDGFPDIGAYEYVEIVSNNDLESAANFNISPNPFSEFLNIEIDCNQLHFEILDLQGKLLQADSIDNINAGLIYLKDGIYVIKLIDKSQSCLKTPVVKTIVKLN